MPKIKELSPQYTRNAPLLDDQCAAEPYEQFCVWYREASEQMGVDAQQMVLATLGKHAVIHQRVVLLKEHSQSGFIFFSNYQSQKGRDVVTHPQVSLLFWWPQCERQIRIQGAIEPTSRSQSEAYFYSRPWASQCAASASQQSQPISREALHQAYQEQVKTFHQAGHLDCPNHWGGYCVTANYYEFWQGGNHRLHDRIVYQKKGAQSASTWQRQRLSP
jgi:pyridoxamine 5'-phosphate oxidase